RYRATGSVLDAYGGQFPSPIRVVAIDFSTAQAYSQALSSEKSPPVRVLVPRRAPASPPRRAQSARFMAELPTHLGLPPREATYDVFLWLDDVVTPVQRIFVAEDPTRAGGFMTHRRGEGALQFLGTEAAAPPASGLQLSSGQGTDSRHVRGRWVPDPQ